MLSFCLVGLGLILFVVVVYSRGRQAPEQIAQVTDNVEITAEIKACILRLKVYPEKRIPRADHWHTTHRVDVYDHDTNTYKGSFATWATSNGISETDLCELGIDTAFGKYDFYVRGDSHLRKAYKNRDGFYYALTEFDLTPEGELLAGETSVIYDNYINALDISTQIVAFETGDYINDLNQDSEVNSLDISNTIYNYYVGGE